MRAPISFTAVLVSVFGLLPTAFAEHQKEPNKYDRTADVVFSEIHSDWTGTLKKLQSNLDSKKSYLIFALREPTLAMDLRSAELFRRSFVVPGIDRLDKAELGHGMVAWQCVSRDGNVIRGATGLTGEGRGQTRNLAMNGWGLSTMLSTHTDGYLQSAKELSDVLTLAGFKYRLWGSIFEVDQDSCGGVVDFVKAFVFHKNRPMQNFGLMVDPEQMEGGGCGSWLVAILNQSKIFNQTTIENLKREIYAPTSLFGYGLDVPPFVIPYHPQNIPVGAPARKVNFFRLLDGPWIGDGAQESVRFVDPEMVILLIGTLYELHMTALQNDFSQGRISEEAYEREVYAYTSRYPSHRKIISRTPWSEADPLESMRGGSAPYFHRYYDINANFDSQTQIISNEVTAWWKARPITAAKSKMIFHDNSAYLLIRK